MASNHNSIEIGLLTIDDIKKKIIQTVKKKKIWLGYGVRILVVCVLCAARGRGVCLPHEDGMIMLYTLYR